MATVIVTGDTVKDILEENSVVVLDFWASWCGPCKMISPIIETLSEEYPNILFGKVNTDEESALIKEYELISIPTLIAFSNHQEVSRRTGKASAEELRSFLSSAFKL